MRPDPAPHLRPIAPADVPAVLALNEADVHLLAPMDEARLDELLGWAERGDVVDVGGVVAGFVLTIRPGSPYDSENYRWFTERYDDFGYLDRVVLGPAYRRQGLGGLVYDAVEADAAAHGRLALEVNSRPANEPSLAFHAARGFTVVGERVEPGKTVAMMVKELRPGPGRSS